MEWNILRACLDNMKTEWYHSIFMIHHPKQVGPTDDKVFGLVLDDCFTQKLKSLSLDEKKKKILVFLDVWVMSLMAIW